MFVVLKNHVLLLLLFFFRIRREAPRVAPRLARALQKYLWMHQSHLIFAEAMRKERRGWLGGVCLPGKDGAGFAIERVAGKKKEQEWLGGMSPCSWGVLGGVVGRFLAWGVLGSWEVLDYASS